MSWAVGFDERWQRDVGYGVPAICDHPDCDRHIDRGLAYVCGGEPYGGEDGCGLFFCSRHQYLGVEGKSHQVCDCCAEGKAPFAPKADVPEWVRHKLRDPSWRRWREENLAEVQKLLQHNEPERHGVGR